MPQVDRNSIEIVGPKRAAFAGIFPIRAKHEVLDDKLRAIAEQLRQGFLSVGRVERIVLFHPHPRQGAPLGTESISFAGEGLFPGQVLPARFQPRLTGNHGMSVDHLVSFLFADCLSRFGGSVWPSTAASRSNCACQYLL